MIDPKKILRYYGKILLALVAFLGLLLILAIAAELYKEHVPPGDLDLLFAIPGIQLRLIRDMLPGILAVSAAFFLASNFTASLHELNNWREGAGHIRRCTFGQPTFSPFVRVADAKVGDNVLVRIGQPTFSPRVADAEVGDNVLARIGGPGNILVYNDSAVVLEQGGRLTRVLGPGKIDSLKPFERVRDVIDVRPMRWEYDVSALSKEGIPVTLSADVSFQIDTMGRDPTVETPYPVLDETVFKASTSRWMRAPDADEDDQYFDWARRVIISETEGKLRGIVARYPLDALVGLEGMPASGTTLPREAIQEELAEALREPAANLGAQINKVRLGAIRMDDKVAEQWIQVWGNEWRYWAMVQEKAGEATRDQLREVAKAQAQVDMITAVARAFQQSVSRDARIPSQLLVMRLLEVFDRSRIGPYTYLPGQAIETLDRLRKLVIKEPTESLSEPRGRRIHPGGREITE